jgi:transposase InsO family protein
VHLPRTALLFLCAGLTTLAYGLILFTDWGSAYHGGSYRGAVITQAVAALAAFSCLEVVRSERVTAFRALAGALGVPLLLVLLLTLWYGARRYVAG